MTILELALGVLGTVHVIARSGQLRLDEWRRLAMTFALAVAVEAAWHTTPPAGVGTVFWVVVQAAAVTVVAAGLTYLAEAARPPADSGDNPRPQPLGPPASSEPPPPVESFGGFLHRVLLAVVVALAVLGGSVRAPQ